MPNRTVMIARMAKGEYSGEAGQQGNSHGGDAVDEKEDDDSFNVP